MPDTDSKKSIAESRGSFNKLLKTREYQEVISDDVQCQKLIELLKVQPNGYYLDLATGAGYVGFAIAERYPESSVVGIDIADEIIESNLKEVREKSITNMDFKSFDGVTFPDCRKRLDGVICRYALHHFPRIETTLEYLKRFLKPDSRVVISDAVKNEHDHANFINKFQELKKDGHFKIYTKNELLHLFNKAGFVESESFDSVLTFSRELSSQYKSLLEVTSSEILNKYSVTVVDNRVTLTFNIFNLAFEIKS